MVSDQQLRHIEREHGVLFGLKWSALGCALALCFLLSGCALFDSGSVRYNSVVGEKRVPTLNPGGVGFASTDMAKNQMQQSQMVVQNYASPPMSAQDAGMSNEAAALFAANQQQAAMPQAPMPQQAPAPTPMTGPAMAPAMPADGAYPQLPPTQAQPQPMGDDAAIKAEIDALERDMASTQSQRQQMATQEQDSSWLPNLGVSDWFASDAPSQPSATPIAPTASQAPVAGGGYAPVQLPVPPSMPSMINEPAPPVAASAPSSVEVPLAPLVHSTAPTNVPTSLIPPDATLTPSSGYLQDSRYSSRRNYSKP